MNVGQFWQRSFCSRNGGFVSGNGRSDQLSAGLPLAERWVVGTGTAGSKAIKVILGLGSSNVALTPESLINFMECVKIKK
jgi:hypothetical protein